jgi:membrane protease YdiL (CAAX protease family)
MPQSELAFGAFVSASIVAVWVGIAWRLVERRPLVAYEPRLRVRWNIADVFFLFVLWPILELGALRLAIPRAELLSGAFSAASLAAVTSAHALWVVVALVYLEARTGVRARGFGFDTSQLGRDIRLGALAFLAAAPVVYGIQLLVSQFWEPLEHPLAKLIMQKPDTLLLALAAVSAMAVAPLSEEFLFRVVLQGWLERPMRRLRRRGRFWALSSRVFPIITSAGLFALMHQGADRIALFVLALFLGYLYRQTGRIYPSLVLHACVNSLAVLALWLGVD